MDSWSVCMRAGWFMMLTRAWMSIMSNKIRKINLQHLSKWQFSFYVSSLPLISSLFFFLFISYTRMISFSWENSFPHICSNGLSIFFITLRNITATLTLPWKPFFPSRACWLHSSNFVALICILKNCFFLQKNSVSKIHGFWCQLKARLMLGKIITESKIIYNILEN